VAASEGREVQASQGTPEQLPQGAAQAVNEATPSATELNPDAETAPTSGGSEDTSLPEMAAPSDYQPMPQSDSENDDFIMSPTTRPQEPVTEGTAQGGKPPLPADFDRWFPTFAEAADAMDAPLQLKILVAALREMSL